MAGQSRQEKKGFGAEASHISEASAPEPLRLSLALIFMVWSFGTYQALVPYFIAVSSIFFLVFYLYGQAPSDISWSGLCLRMILMFLTGFLGYLILSKAIIYVRFGTFRTYLTDSYMSWGSVPLAQCISNILGDIKRLVFRELPVYSRLYVPVTLGTFMLSMHRGLTLKRKGAPWLMAGLLVMISSCFFMTFVLGNYQVLRANMTEPLTFAFSAAFLCLLLRDLEAWSLVKRLRSGRLLRYGCLLVLSMGLMSQLDMTNRYAELIHQVAEADVRMAEDIYDRTSSMRAPENRSETPMVFAGSWSPDLPDNGVQPWDATGISFFSIDSSSVQGSARIARFMNILGLETAEPDAVQYAAAMEAAESMPCWPSEGSCIYKDGVIIVKLSQ